MKAKQVVQIRLDDNLHTMSHEEARELLTSLKTIFEPKSFTFDRTGTENLTSAAGRADITPEEWDKMHELASKPTS